MSILTFEAVLEAAKASEINVICSSIRKKMGFTYLCLLRQLILGHGRGLLAHRHVHPLRLPLQQPQPYVLPQPTLGPPLLPHREGPVNRFLDRGLVVAIKKLVLVRVCLFFVRLGRLDAAPLPPLPRLFALDAAVDQLQLLVEQAVRVVRRLQGQPRDRRPGLPPARLLFER